MLHHSRFAAIALVMSSAPVWAAECKILDTQVFTPQIKTIALANQGASSTSAIVFKSALRVNTDGAPTSYHPDDPKGTNKAINNIINGVAVAKAGSTLTYSQKISAFEKFRDNGWKVPAGHTINWGNVIATVSLGGKKQPCVFSSGTHKGYFGSLTTLKNGLPSSQWGECESANQLDQRIVPGLVLPGGTNPLKAFGAKIGDLLLAYNPANGVAVAAVMADGGPPHNLGEGSVALNMALLQKTTQPTTYAEAKKLDTGTSRMMVAILPGTKSFQTALPYTAESISARVAAWATANGYTDLNGLTAFLAKCKDKL